MGSHGLNGKGHFMIIIYEMIVTLIIIWNT